jgi:large subunit ribosomal protein L24
MTRLKKGDTILVITGRDKGKRGKITEVLNRKEKDITSFVVDGINVVKRHIKPKQNFPQGGILEKELPIFQSKIMLVCPICNEASRLGRRRMATGKYARFCKKCGENIDKV